MNTSLFAGTTMSGGRQWPQLKLVTLSVMRHSERATHDGGSKQPPSTYEAGFGAFTRSVGIEPTPYRAVNAATNSLTHSRQ